MEHSPGLSRRDRRRLDTREEILVAARELMLEVGPEALSLRQVARRADFSPAALYTYFASRDEIVAALFAESFERLGMYLQRVPSDLPIDTRLVELGMAYVDFARENPVDLRCILQSTSQEGLPSSSGVAMGLDAARVIAESFREGRETGIIRTDVSLSSAEMAFTTWALVHGMAVLSSLEMGEVRDIAPPAPRRVLEAFVALLTTSEPR